MYLDFMLKNPDLYTQKIKNDMLMLIFNLIIGLYGAAGVLFVQTTLLKICLLYLMIN